MQLRKAFPKMVSAIFISALLGLVASSAAVELEFSYDAQDEWPGICVTGNEMRQSPIDIILEDVEENDDLIDLKLTKWDENMDGVFANTGENVQILLALQRLATTSGSTQSSNFTFTGERKKVRGQNIVLMGSKPSWRYTLFSSRKAKTIPLPEISSL